MSCVQWPEASLNVCDYVHAYINRTLSFHIKAVRKGLPKPVQLFLSHRTGRPVQRASISRWIREVLCLSGINVDQYGPGSTRGAASSLASTKGATAEQIMKAGSWSNVHTFIQHYQRRVEDTPVGHLILQDATVSVRGYVFYDFYFALCLY